MAAELFKIPSKALDQNANPYSGAKAYFYATGTTTPQNVFSDADLNTSLGAVLTADANGKFENAYLNSSTAYRVIIKSSDGATTLHDMDPFNSTAFIDLAAGGGADLVGYDPASTFSANTVGFAIYNDTLTPAHFATTAMGITNDTVAFQGLAAAYFAGRSVHIPDIGKPYLIDPDTIIFKPPASYNGLYKSPPTITCDPSATIKARSGGAFLIQLGTKDSDYSGYLRAGEFDLPWLDGNNYTFTKAPLYAPFFLDCTIHRRVKNAKRLAWLGDTTAPAASAGLKGKVYYTNDINLWRATVSSITNAANPVVTLSAANALWPTSGKRVVCINFATPGGWSSIHNKPIDCVVTSSTTLQLKNVDSTAFGAISGTVHIYLNCASMAVPKAISGVTNANPCVITTAVPHLLTTGDKVDIAEIGGMDPSLDAGRTGIQGQYNVTVLTDTTFSIPLNTTSTTTYGSYSSTLGTGFVMPWTEFTDCDIGDYLDNCTDADCEGGYVFEVRLPFYSNPATGGYDGKYTNLHCYNLPEYGEILTPFYMGGDSDWSGCQIDGPFRYAGWVFAGRNTLRGHKLNFGGVGGVDGIAAMVRSETGASVRSSDCGLKGNSTYQLLKDHSGGGTYDTDGSNFYSNVKLPVVEHGSGKRAASVRFVGSSGAAVSGTQNQVSVITRSSAGTYVLDFNRAVPLNCLFFGTAGTSAYTVAEDESYGSRSIYKRKIIVSDASGTAVDAATVTVKWEYP